MEIDLRKCKKGDVLFCKNGAICIYDRPTEESDYYDHYVDYLFAGDKFNDGNLGKGTRTHDGFVFRQNRKEEDFDVIRIVSQKDLIKKLKSYEKYNTANK